MSFGRRDLFWYCAGALSVLVIGLLVRALNGPISVPATSPAALAEAATETNAPASAMPAPTPSASAPKAAGTMDEVLDRLQTRLASQGGSDADWELLAQTYEFVGRSADAKLARAHQLPPLARGAAPLPSTAAPGRSEMPSATAGMSALSGAVELSAALKSKVPEGLTLFIVAKSVDSPGPPVAIVRTTTGHWPLPFTLDDSNAMMPGRTLSNAQRITIEARVSRSGMAAPQPGDYQSSIISLDAHASKADARSVRIVIDHVIG